MQEANQTLLIKSSSKSEGELKELIPLITVGETYFFRNPTHTVALEEYIIPELAKQNRKLNIFSAGCSTGEEPYSLSMLITQKFPNIDYHIYAVDINSAALVKAKKGVYFERSLKAAPEIFVSKYFSRKGKASHLKPEIKKSVTFMEGNLSDENFYKNQRYFDLVICRNVLIYFTVPAVTKIIANFKSIIFDHGFMLLGHSETLRGISDEFVVMENKKAFFYRPVLETKSEIVNQFASIEEPGKIDPADADALNAAAHFTDEKVVKDKSQTEKPKAIDPDEEFHRGLEFLENKQYEIAISIFKAILQSNPDHFKSILGISILEANKDNLPQAFLFCKQGFEIEEFSHQAYCVQGLLFEHDDKVKDAKKSYENSIFLKKDFAPAHYRLAELNFQLELFKEAAKSYRNAVKYFKEESREMSALYLGGFPVSSVSQICKQRLETIKKAQEVR